MGWSSAVWVLALAMAILYIPSWLFTPPTTSDGYSSPEWEEVAQVFRNNVDNGREKGAQLAIYYQGQLVVDLVGGYADDEGRVPMHRDHLILVASCVKAVSAVVIGTLVDKGLLSYDKPVAHYWPEFAVNGKDNITVKQLLSHQAGLAALDEEFVTTDFTNNPELVAEILAKQAPNWTPGTKHGYHGTTMVPYMDQFVRRLDPRQRNISQYFKEEIAKIFGIDFHYGLPREEVYRRARNYDMSPLHFLLTPQYWELVWQLADPASLTRRMGTSPKDFSRMGGINHPEFYECPMNGHGTARGLARLMGIVANDGEIEGRRLLSEQVINRLKNPLVSGKDEVARINLTYGLGLTLRETPMGDWAFGAPGGGGQMVYSDPANEIGWTYLTNHHSVNAFGDDPEYLDVERSIYRVLNNIRQKI